MRICVSLFLLFFPFGLSSAEITLAYVDFPPYEYEENGEAKGIQVEIVEELFERAGVRLNLVYLPFPRAYKKVEEGYMDGLFNFYKTASRMERFDYSAPLILNPLMYFVRKDFPLRIETLEDLRGMWVGVMEGYTYGDHFDNSTHFKKDVAGSHVSNLRKLEAGRIDVYPVDRLVGIYTAHQLGMTNEFNILPDPLVVMEGHIGFTKNRHEHLITKLNEILADMRQSGRIEAIAHAYMERLEQRDLIHAPFPR